MAQQIGKQADAMSIRYPYMRPPPHRSSRRAREGVVRHSRCDDGVDKTTEWGAALEGWAKAHMLKAGRLPREKKKTGETGADFSDSPLCYRHTLFRLIICLRATGHISLNGGDKEGRGLNEFLEAITDTSEE